MWLGLPFLMIVIFFIPANVGALQPCGNDGSPGIVFEILPQGLKTLMKSDPNLFIVDVREKQELETLKTIEPSVNIPLGLLQQGKWTPPVGKTLVFICHSGRRSLIAAKLMARRGCTAYTLKGGLVGWNKFIKPDVGKDKPVDEENGEKSPDVTDMGC